MPRPSVAADKGVSRGGVGRVSLVKQGKDEDSSIRCAWRLLHETRAAPAGLCEETRQVLDSALLQPVLAGIPNCH